MAQKRFPRIRCFLKGAGTLLDLLPAQTPSKLKQRKNRILVYHCSDREAMRQDWQAVGGDLFAAMQRVRAEAESERVHAE